MKTTANIRIKGDLTEAQFEWCSFDGDDCFNDFHINVITESDTRRYDFGRCAIQGLRKLRTFFQDASLGEPSLGFRHPDIRYCDVHRADDGYRLVVRFEDSGLKEEHLIHQPQVQIDDDFLRTVYSS
jgi:hypothetical protein